MRLFLIINIVLLLTILCNSKTNPDVRQSALAGSWYPSNPSKLAYTIDNLIAKSGSKEVSKKPILLVVPHAGYIYSGRTSAAGYNMLKDLSPDIIIILGPSHYGYFNGCSILPVDYYETPLGRVSIDRDIVNKLLREPLFQTDEYAHIREHSIEIQLPFLQRLYQQRLEGDIGIVPILVGNINDGDAVKISRSIIKSLDEKMHPIFIVSSDFTHYGEKFGYLPFKSKNKKILKEKIRELDHGAIDPILIKDRRAFCDYIKKTGITICGRNPIKIALSLPIKDFSADLISYDTSGSITGDSNNSVSYATISFAGSIINDYSYSEDNKEVDKDFHLSVEDKKYLLKLAKSNIESILNSRRRIKIDQKSVPDNCKIITGVFVTLKKNGDLRGCIGYIEGLKPLYQAVIDNSQNAAFKDPRFPHLKKNELKDIKIEISVLTVPKPVESVEEIEIGKDGLIIKQGNYKGLLLPQVAREWKFNREEFLIRTCRKAGLPDYAWKHGAEIYRFQAIVFNENEL